MKGAKLNPKRATPRQLAEHLSTTDSTVITWMKKGKIPAVVREGRIYRFDIEAVDKVLEERANKQADGEPVGPEISLPTAGKTKPSVAGTTDDLK